MSSPAAGWYPNPDRSGSYLYWNGQAWVGEPKSKEDLEASTSSASQPRSAEHVEVKVGLFGGKKAAQAYADEAQALKVQLAELQAAVAKYGIADDIKREEARRQLTIEMETAQTALEALKSGMQALNDERDSLLAALVDLRTSAGLQSMGLYDFEHPAETSVDLSAELEKVRAQIKSMVSDKIATTAAPAFMFNNSAAEGAKFVRDMSALLLRAYNAEAENCVKGAKAGNQEANIKRLNTAVGQIEKQGRMISLQITPAFHALRLREIDLATRYLKILADEKAAEAERKAQLREDAKVARELERESKKLADNKSMIEAALKSAQDTGDTEGIARYENQLQDVIKNLEEVAERAANRRMGHVYVISNIGAFGQDVVKIGMTRRMDPYDRVRELGDASVPFRFDVHAMIFSDDAVGLETALHQKFEAQRVNKINAHREFFRVTPEMVLAELKREQVIVVSYTIEPEAQEFRASIGQIDASKVSVEDDFANEDSAEEEEAAND